MHRQDAPRCPTMCDGAAREAGRVDHPAGEGGRFRYFNHTADVGVEAWGDTLAEAFRCGARAVLELMFDPATVPEDRTVELRLSAGDPGALLVGFINEIIYLVYGEGFLPRSVAVSEVRSPERTQADEPWSLRASVVGCYRCEVPEGRGVAFRTEVKAATYHGLVVERVPEKAWWRVRFVVDV